METLKDKVAIVTGGAQGIGRAIAEVFAERGADVVLADIQIDKANETANHIIEHTGQQAMAFRLDATSLEQANAMVEKTVEVFGNVHILVNNVGTTRDTLLMRMPESDWDLVLNVNLKSVFNCSKAVVRQMMRSRYGRIINMSSVAGIAGNAGQTNYSSSKAGIIGFTRSLAREVASRNITVNAVAPGFVVTDLTADLPQEIKDASMLTIPMGRWGEPVEIAHAVAFLASDDAKYITGHVLSVDGGMVMG
ncbi:MAG: 3-oxoacyl-[acyl-carrier-protein] reductase [Chloroflexota bacterium]|jgi:3-oxoacyl-[acyl-carrier protein] reductase